MRDQAGVEFFEEYYCHAVGIYSTPIPPSIKSTFPGSDKDTDAILDEFESKGDWQKHDKLAMGVAMEYTNLFFFVTADIMQTYQGPNCGTPV